MDWRDDHTAPHPEMRASNAAIPTFLYAMPFSKTRCVGNLASGRHTAVPCATTLGRCSSLSRGRCRGGPSWWLRMRHAPPAMHGPSCFPTVTGSGLLVINNVLPLRIFLEETSLVARPAVGFNELKERLDARLKWLGIKVGWSAG